MFNLFPVKEVTIKPSLACPECGQRLLSSKKGYECSDCGQSYSYSELMQAYSLLSQANRARQEHKREEIDHIQAYREELEAERTKVQELENTLKEMRVENHKLHMDQIYADPVWANHRIDALEDRLARLEGLYNSKSKIREYA